MPVGVLLDAAVFAGGIIGSFLGPGLRQDFKENLNMILGVCSMTIGISAIVLMKNMPAAIFATILGTVIGLDIHLGDKIHAAGRGMQRIVSKFVKAPCNGISSDEFTSALIRVIVLFCASGVDQPQYFSRGLKPSRLGWFQTSLVQVGTDLAGYAIFRRSISFLSGACA